MNLIKKKMNLIKKKVLILSICKQLYLKLISIMLTQFFIYIFISLNCSDLIIPSFLDLFINPEKTPSIELVNQWEEDNEDPSISKEDRALMVKRDYVQCARVSLVSFFIVLVIIWFVDNPEYPAEWWPTEDE